MAIVDVPGESAQGLYNSALPARPSLTARPGQWVPVRNAACDTPCRHGSWLFGVMIALVVIISGMRPWQPDSWTRFFPQQRPVECTEPEAPSEEATPPAKPAREYTPPTENEDEF